MALAALAMVCGHNVTLMQMQGNENDSCVLVGYINSFGIHNKMGKTLFALHG